MNIERLKKQLKIDEGIRLFPYRCTANKLTIGIGRNIEDKGISEKEAEFLLQNDIEKLDIQFSIKFDWYSELSDLRKEVVLNMAFNLGFSGFCKFRKTIYYIENGDYESASKEMLRSQWAEQVGTRAKRLSALMKGA